MTNGDRIRQMSNEELTEIFEGNCHYCLFYINGNNKRGICGEMCLKGIKAYLDMEAEE